MQLHRSNFLKFILQPEAGKPAIANGLRGTLALGVPMLIGQLTNNRESSLLVALIAYFVNLANVGGPYRIKATGMTVATFGIAVSVFVGTLVAGMPKLTVLLTLLWGIVAGLLWLYGDAGSIIGLVIGISFIFAITNPGGVEIALTRFILCLIAGGWAMLLSLVMWPFTPYKPLRAAVASCYKALADYVWEFQESAIQTEVDSKKLEYILKIRQALERARTALGTQRMGQQAQSWMDEQLLVLIQDAERMFGSVTALIELVEVNVGYQPFLAVELLVGNMLEQIASIIQSIAQVISSQPAIISLEHLSRIHEALQEQERLQRKAFSGLEQDYPALVSLTNLVQLIEKLIRQFRYTADSARSLNNDIKNARRGVDPLLLTLENQQTAKSSATLTPLMTLWDNLTLDSAIFRHSLRLGITLAIGVIIYTVAKLPMGYWSTLTILFVLKPDFGETFKRFAHRVGGTILGAIVAAILIATIANESVLNMITLLAVFFGVSLLKVHYGYAVIFFSIFVLLLSDIAHPVGWQFAGVRVVNTLIGAGLAIGGHYLMWPNWERQRFSNQLSVAVRECRNYFQTVMAVYLGDEESRATIACQKRRTGLAIINAQASCQGLLGEPQTPSELVEPLIALLVYVGRFNNAVTILAVYLDHFCGTQPLPELETFVRQISVLLEQIADALQEEISPPSSLPDLEGTLQKIHSHLQVLRVDCLEQLATTDHQQALSCQTVNDYSAVEMELDQILRRATALHSALVRLSSALQTP